MAKYSTDQIRNVAVLGHGGSGKTSITEALLYNSGAISRIGRVEDGSTSSDYDPEEQRRGISISLSVVPIETSTAKVNLVDTPGYLDFIGEVISALDVCEAGLVVIDAVAGVEVGTELVWRRLDDLGKPRVVFVNKMDRENADFVQALASLRAAFPDSTIMPFQLPVGQADQFRGVISLIDMRAYMGKEATAADLPADLADQVEATRLELVEAAAETDDDLLVKYLDGKELTAEEVRHGLHHGVRRGAIVPVYCGSAQQNIGMATLIRSLERYVPTPSERTIEAEDEEKGEQLTLQSDASGVTAAWVFKTVIDRYVGRMNYVRLFSGTIHKDDRLVDVRTGEDDRIANLFRVCGKELEPVAELVAGDLGVITKLENVITGDTLCAVGRRLRLPSPTYPSPLYTYAVSPATKADSAKMGQALNALVEEDPTLKVENVATTRQMVLQGMGEAHLDVAVRRLDSKYGTKVETAIPKVPYQETITGTGQAVYRHKKQTGGAGQFAEVHLRVEPRARGEGFEYASEVFGGAISHVFIPSIEKGIRQVLDQGVIAGYPVVDVKAIVFDGKEHPVDSKDIAFQIAGREVFRMAMKEAGAAILEPIYRITVTVSEEYMGDVMGDLNTRRGRVSGMEQQGSRSTVTALVPLAEIMRYGTDLRSMTQGRGVYSIEFDHYEPVPAHLVADIVAKGQQEHEANH